MIAEIHIPLTEIRVQFSSGSRRPVTQLDRLVMQAITAGANSVDQLRPIFQLPERLLVECLVDLMGMALLALNNSGNGFLLTEFGTQALEQGLTDFGEQVDVANEMTFLREDLTGRIGNRFGYVLKKGDIPAQIVRSHIPHGEIESLLLQHLKRDGKHLHSLDSVVPVRDGISLKVTVNQGGVSGLPSQLSHLQPLLIAEAQKRGVHYKGPMQHETPSQDIPWCEISFHQNDLLLTASSHETALLDAIAQAESHLLILSAHVSEKTLDALKVPIAAAIMRGVRVDVLWGFPAVDEGAEPHSKIMAKWQKEVRKSAHNGTGENLMTNESPLNADAKVLIWDQEGSYRAIVGSYNWLYGYGSDGLSSHDLGTEVGIRLSDPRLISNICITLSGWLHDEEQQANGMSLRWQKIALHIAQKEAPDIRQDSATVRAYVIYDERHAEILREGQMSATRRLLLTSHKLNRSATGNLSNGGGKLAWLTYRNSSPEFEFVLRSGRRPKSENWAQEDQERLESLVKGAGGTIHLGDGTHARVMVYDDVSIVSSYNFLATTRDKRQIGLIFKGASVANALWATFQPPRVRAEVEVSHRVD